jgi:bifunctional non-homologous end joining protein LigD
VNVEGKRVVVTGAVPGFSRATAEQWLAMHGAHVQPRVTRDTDLLICGSGVGGTKIKAAEKNGTQVVDWEDVAVPSTARASSPKVIEAEREVVPRRQVFPMLCQKADELPTIGEWTYELKWDGHRCVAHVVSGEVRLFSRQGNETTHRWPEIAQALEGLSDCVLDGEAVVFGADGVANVELLGEGHARFVVFDVLEADGTDCRRLRIEDRRAVVEELLRGGLREGESRVAASSVFEDGEALLDHVKVMGWEGIVAKKAGSAYEEGKRPPTWLKLKVRTEQEFVVVGWTWGKNGNAGNIGACVVAVWDGEQFVYAGRVGWTDPAMLKLLQPLEQERCECSGVPRKEEREAVWVKPQVVIQVDFQRWTRDGRLWHPIGRYVRDDKDPREVVRET